jgi:3(or 17)beta-hydroxysteroid dehydrogenase
MDRVKNKVALITGGSLGLGACAAELLAREGAKIVVTDVRDEEGEEIAAKINAAGGQARFLHHDVADEAAWIEAVGTTVSVFGRLDILVNNAGIGPTGTIENTSFADYRKLMSINMDGVFLGVKYGIKAMKEGGSAGSIVNLSSIEGLIGDPDLAAYNASKGGVRLLTKSAALHCALTRTGIRVNSIHPGYILTPMVRGMRRVGGWSGQDGGSRRSASCRPSRRTRGYRVGNRLSRVRRGQVHHRGGTRDRWRLHRTIGRRG